MKKKQLRNLIYRNINFNGLIKTFDVNNCLYSFLQLMTKEIKYPKLVVH